MSWRVADPSRCYRLWADGKDSEDQILLVAGLIELADRPLSELPGLRVAGRSPMNRWTIIGSTAVIIRVYESIGLFDLVDLRDF